MTYSIAITFSTFHSQSYSSEQALRDAYLSLSLQPAPNSLGFSDDSFIGLLLGHSQVAVDTSHL